MTVTDQAGNTASEAVALNVTPASVPPSTVVTVASGTASSPASISLSVPSGPSISGTASGGSGTVAVAAETSNPTTVNVQAATSYFDISLASQSTFTSLNLTFCHLNGATAVYWFNGSSWAPASDQTYAPSTGCVNVAITSTTSPSLSELTGTSFAAVNAPVITTTSLPAGTVGQPYSATLAATGGTTPYTWSLPSGQLPNGLSLSAQGTISGTPTQAGTASFTVQVTDANGLSQTASLSISIGTPAVVGGGGGGGGAPAPSPSPAPTPSPSGPVSQSIGQSGGSMTATSSNGTQIAVSVPAGAVNQTTNVTVNPLTSLPSSVSSISVLQAVDLSATPSASFAQPVTVTLTFTASPGNVSVVFWNPLTPSWQPMANIGISGDTVTFKTRHFTVFAVVSSGTVPLVKRLAGATRLETAILAAEAAYPEGASAVVLANAGQGAPSPDALAAAGLAGAINGPILLTQPDQLPSEVLQAIKTLGANTVYVVGGPAAVSDAVVNQLTAQGLALVRQFEGADRFETAALIDQYLYSQGLTSATTVYVANGATMVDALSAGSALFQEAAPLILVNTGQTALPSAAYQAMQEANIQRVVILGGPAAVSSALQQAIAQALPNATIQRYGGATRNATAAAFDKAYFGQPSGGAVIAANGGGGGSFVDALAAAPLAGVNGVPILLTNPTSLPNSTVGYLSGMASNQPIWVMGGTAAVSDQVVSALTPSGTGSSAPIANGG